MATTTSTPAETLKGAFDAVGSANQFVEEQSAALAAAQAAAETASANQAVVQVELQNAQAKYSVLSKSVELAGPAVAALQATLGERERELSHTIDEIQQVEVETENARRSRSSLDELVEAAQGWIAQAGDAARALRDFAIEVESFRPGGASAARLGNILQGLRDLHTQLQERLEVISLALQELRTGIDRLSVAASPTASLVTLMAKRKRLEGELVEIKSELAAKQPRVDQRQLQEAQVELDAAQQAADAAPTAAQSAQNQVQVTTAALAGAQEDLLAAQQALDAVQAEFVTGIVVSKPNAAGFATARALLKQPIPVGFMLSWQAGGAPVEPESPTGEKVRIDARTLPAGPTTVTAILKPESSTS
jgi:DNA repair exonuclease SbcCD ATPase subunit